MRGAIGFWAYVRLPPSNRAQPPVALTSVKVFSISNESSLAAVRLKSYSRPVS